MGIDRITDELIHDLIPNGSFIDWNGIVDSGAFQPHTAAAQAEQLVTFIRRCIAPAPTTVPT